MNDKLDRTTDIIHGHCDLVLKAGDEYEIRFGIHQGTYIYEGRRYEKWDKEHKYGEHMFRNKETGEISFSYFGSSSPYEFTSIVMKK